MFEQAVRVSALHLRPQLRLRRSLRVQRAEAPLNPDQAPSGVSPAPDGLRKPEATLFRRRPRLPCRHERKRFTLLLQERGWTEAGPRRDQPGIIYMRKTLGS